MHTEDRLLAAGKTEALPTDLLKGLARIPKHFAVEAIKQGYCSPRALLRLRQRTGLAESIAHAMVRENVITAVQARVISVHCGAPALVGGFDVLDALGQGGMGTVYRASQASLDRVVALKVLSRQHAQHSNFAERFLREARVLAQLSHGNIVGGIDCGEDHGLAWFAMEFVDGPNLRQRIARHGRMNAPLAAKIVGQIARALAYAEQRGLVHRDIKPENIMLCGDGSAKLCDLGLARKVGEEDANLTQAGMAVGTPQFMSPEQAMGESQITVRSDVYSLGATFYFALTAEPLFLRDNSMKIMRAHIFDAVPSPCERLPEIPPAYGALLARMMAKQAMLRYTPGELLEELERAEQNKPVEALKFKEATSCQMPPALRAQGSSAQIRRRSSTTLPTRKRPRANPAPMIVAAGVMLLLAVAVLASRTGTPPRPEPKPPTPPPLPTRHAKEAPPEAAPRPRVTATPTTCAAEEPRRDPPDGPREHAQADVSTARPVLEPVPQESRVCEVQTSAAPAPALAPQPQVVAGVEDFRALAKFLAARQGKSLAAARKEWQALSDAEARTFSAASLAEFAEAVGLEQAAAADLAARGETIDLGRLATTGPFAKAVKADPDRGLEVESGGVRLFVSAAAVPLEQLLRAMKEARAAERWRYCLYRFAFAEADRAMAAVDEQDRARAQALRGLFGAAQTQHELALAVAAVEAAVRERAWDDALRLAADARKRFGASCATSAAAADLERLESLAYASMLAAGRSTPRARKLNAAAVQLGRDGVLNVSYDFSQPEQAQDFVSPEITPTIRNRKLRVAAAANEQGLPRLNLPMRELRSLDLTGECSGARTRALEVRLATPPGVEPSQCVHLMLSAEQGKATLTVNGATQSVACLFDPQRPAEIAVRVQDGTAEWTVGGKAVGTHPATLLAHTFLILGSANGPQAWSKVQLACAPAYRPDCIEQSPPKLRQGLLGEYFTSDVELRKLPARPAGPPHLVRIDPVVDMALEKDHIPGTDLWLNVYIRWTGKLKIEKPGTYTFTLISDDGSALEIDGETVIDHDGIHQDTPKRGTVELTAGYHDLRVEYFNGWSHAGCCLFWKGPGIANQKVPASALYSAERE